MSPITSQGQKGEQKICAAKSSRQTKEKKNFEQSYLEEQRSNNKNRNKGSLRKASLKWKKKKWLGKIESALPL